MTISAIVIADSISPAHIRLTTMQLRYPKFIHGEFMTHRVFSRNASSSRAIPVERLIKDVIDDPVYPSFWGKNQPGMQAREEHNDPINPDNSVPASTIATRFLTRKEAWDEAREQAVAAAYSFANAGYHKQIVNRLLEPFCHINVVVTSTEWENFFELRCHPDAQPEMRILAEAMKKVLAYGKSIQRFPGDDWHLPYVTNEEWQEWLTDGYDVAKTFGIKASIARCARVSYLTQEGKKPDIGSDLKLYHQLVGSVPLHASPAEHQATPDKWNFIHERWDKPERHGNLRGWIQYRKILEEEAR